MAPPSFPPIDATPYEAASIKAIPKPSIEPYKKIIQKYGIDPEYCVFIEDIARNLKPAYELGMKTAWIKNNEPWAAEFSNESFIDYKIDNLSGFLRRINE